MVPETLIHRVEGKADFSIIEILNHGKRTWIERGVGGKAEDLMPARGYWHERNQETWVHREGYVEDGRLVNWTKVSKMYNAECLFLYHSFATDAEGNLLRRFICSRPDLGYKITKDIWATRIPGEISIQKGLAGLDDSSRLEHWYPLLYWWYVAGMGAPPRPAKKGLPRPAPQKSKSCPAPRKLAKPAGRGKVYLNPLKIRPLSVPIRFVRQ